MSRADGRQARLVGDAPSGDAVTIATSGRVIRPALAPANALVDEIRLRFDDGGLSLCGVDAPSVAMVETQVFPRAFESYQFDGTGELVVGANLSALTGRLADARKGKSTDDPVTLDIDGDRIVAEVEREYELATARFAHELLTIDPDSLREEPTVPDFETAVSATIDSAAFADAIDHADRASDHAELSTSEDGDLLVRGRGEDTSAAVAFDGVAHGEDAEGTLYSIDYLRDIAAGAAKALPDAVSLSWSNGFPLSVQFRRSNEDGDPLYRTQMCLAPRITGDDDE